MKTFTVQIPVVVAKHEKSASHHYVLKNMGYHFKNDDYRRNICNRIFIACQSRVNYVIASALWKEKKKTVSDPTFTKTGKIKKGTENNVKFVSATWRRNFYEISHEIIKHFDIVEIINDTKKATLMKTRDGKVLNHKFVEVGSVNNYGRIIKH